MIIGIKFDDDEYFVLAKELTKLGTFISIVPFEFDEYPVHIKLDESNMTLCIKIANTNMSNEIIRESISVIRNKLGIVNLDEACRKILDKYFEKVEMVFNL